VILESQATLVASNVAVWGGRVSAAREDIESRINDVLSADAAYS